MELIEIAKLGSSVVANVLLLWVVIFAYTFPFEGNWTIGSQQSAISSQ